MFYNAIRTRSTTQFAGDVNKLLGMQKIPNLGMPYKVKLR